MSALRHAPARDRRPIATDRVKTLSLALREEFSAPFAFYDATTGGLISDRQADAPARAPEELLAGELAIAAGGRPHVGLRGDTSFRLVLPIRAPDGSVLVAIGD